MEKHGSYNYSWCDNKEKHGISG